MNDLRPFRFWCQKVLPLVYDDSLSYYELLCKVIDYLNKTMENVNELSENFDELQQMFNTLKAYVDNYFNNLDVQEEINNKLDEMAKNGTLEKMIQPYIDDFINNTYKIIGFPPLHSGNDPEGSCGFAKISSDSCILFDLGYTANYESIKNYLYNLGITKINAIVISHYHDDHVGDITQYVRDFDVSDCTLFLPLTTNKFEHVVERHNNIINAYNWKQVIYPNAFETYNVDVYNLTFANCGPIAIAHWDDNTNDYNNYSMVTYLKYKNTCVLYTGDINIEAQNYIYDNNWYMPTDIVTAPHHSNNYSVNSGLLMELSPKNVYVSDSKGVNVNIGYQDNFTQGCNIFGANMYRNTNNDGVLFQLFKNGTTITNALAQPCQMTGYAGTIDYYIDSTYNGNKNTGSSKHPFTSIRSAIGSCKIGNTYNLHIINCNEENIYARNISNVNFLIDKNIKLGSLSFNGCNNITFYNLKSVTISRNIEIANCNNVQLRNFIGILRFVENSNNVHIRDCSLNSYNNKYFTTVYNSNITFNNLKVISNDNKASTFIHCEFSKIIFLGYSFNTFTGVNIFEIINSTVNAGYDFINKDYAKQVYGNNTNVILLYIRGETKYSILHKGEWHDIT
jgi:competence protein ComEC